MEGVGSSIALKAKIAELHKVKEDTERARDDAIESWLDSRHLIDELEQLQIGLAIAKKRTLISTAAISGLESQLETTTTSIKYKREEELKAIRMTNYINDALDEARKEMEQIKMETDEKRCERLKLKQVLRMRRQTLHALQLNYRALRLEAEAFGSSAAEAVRHFNRSHTINTTVQLTTEDYNGLTRAADEEAFLSDWRVSVTTEQRLAAKGSRDMALKRFKQLEYPENKSEENMLENEITRDDQSLVEPEEVDRGVVDAKTKLLDGAQKSPQQLLREPESSDGKKRSIRKTKPTLFAQLKKFVLQIT